MDFEEVCLICLKNDELVNEFCRLKGIKRPDKRSFIEIEIDKACGYDTNMEFIKVFTDFVMNYVYLPLIVNAN
jgi:hypothetical protein